MKVRRPEWDEHPSSPTYSYARSNQTTMLSAVIGPPRSDRTTCPDAVEAWPPNRKGIRKIRVHRNQATTALLGRVITQLYTGPDLTVCIEHHVPRQARDFAGAQTGLRRQQNHHAIAEWMAAAIGEGEQICDVARSKGLGLFAEHVTHPKLNNELCIDLITNTTRLQRMFDRNSN
jgi:hypothetical protein